MDWSDPEFLRGMIKFEEDTKKKQKKARKENQALESKGLMPKSMPRGYQQLASLILNCRASQVEGSSSSLSSTLSTPNATSTNNKRPLTLDSYFGVKKSDSDSSTSAPVYIPVPASTSSMSIMTPSPPTKKRKKSNASADDYFYCTPMILEWYKAATIWSEIDKMNTKECQEHCRFNNLKVSGAKYILRDRLIDHAKLAQFREENNLTTNDDNVNKEESITSNIIREFASNQLNFSKSVTIFRNHIKSAKKLDTKKDGKNCYEMRLEMTLAAARGIDFQLLKAITGPDRGNYNGKYDEIGIDFQNEICNEFLQLYNECKNLLTKESLNKFIKFVNAKNSSKCEEYGIGYDVNFLNEE